MNDARLDVVLFEDEVVGTLGPVVSLRPAHEVRIGALNLRERIELCSSTGGLFARVRSSVTAGAVLDAPPEDDEGILRVNSRLCAPVEAIEAALDDLATGDALVRDGHHVLSLGRPRRERAAPPSLALWSRPWELIDFNVRMLVADAATLRERGAGERRIHGVLFDRGSARPARLASGAFVSADVAASGSQVTWIEPSQILIGEEVTVRPSAVIDASEGPVILGAGVTVHPLSVVTGPAYLGPGTVVNPGAKIREGTSVGAFCKIGGEIEESLILDLSNKQHDGFLGHALVGAWVNLGADTNASDLKNNYSTVKVDLGEGAIDSGAVFVGPHIGDHVKTGIDTMLTTGAVLGTAANVFGAGFGPRYVPAFSWGGADGLSEYRLDHALHTARTVMARRDALWTREVELGLRRHFAETAGHRERYGVS
jgi:UDP-N-acetylglucosamine diphosphorylase/glucosamine-1-phosphate N-acetyltransferase